MEIIIHGKPLDASERYTSGIDYELARRVINEFFALGPVKEPEALFVEARYWKGTWTSVYTLLLSEKVKDTAGRGSYFALSLVLPQKYCALISDVYRLLEKVVKENVLGVYLNSNVQYVVSNFENTAAFEKLCAKLQSSYVSLGNVEKAFDGSFHQIATFTKDTYCSIYDCDSLAFVQLLKDKGRVIVTEKEDTKDDIAALAIKYRQEAQTAKNDAQSKALRITELERVAKQLEATMQEANRNEGKRLSALKKEITSLRDQYEQVKQSSQTSQQQYEDLRSKVTQAVASLGGVGKSPNYPPTKRKKRKISDYLPAINTMLLLLMVMSLLLNMKGCSGDNKSSQDSEDMSGQVEMVSVDQLKEELQKKDEDIRNLQGELSGLRQKEESYKEDLRNKEAMIEKLRDKLGNPNKSTQGKSNFRASSGKGENQKNREIKSTEKTVTEKTSNP